MSFFESIRTCLRKYGVFSGRARASEYWFWQLAVAVVTAVVFGVFIVPALITMDPVTQEPGVLGTIGSVLWAVVLFGTLVPSIAVAVRRLHDTGKSGWYFLLGYVPFVGSIIIIVLAALPGEIGPNQFGPDPKAQEGPAQPEVAY